MTSTETITFLRHFNRWRRGDDSIPQPQPGKASEAIDAACAHIQLLEQELRAAREQCHKLRLERMAADRAYADICHEMELKEAGK